eukprot:g8771.t1
MKTLVEKYVDRNMFERMFKAHTFKREYEFIDAEIGKAIELVQLGIGAKLLDQNRKLLEHTRFVMELDEKIDEALDLLRNRDDKKKAKDRVDDAVSANEIDPAEVTILKTELLGEGAFGKVYKAKRAGDVCAAKVIFLAGTSPKRQKELYQSFRKEFALMCTTNTCQRVVRVYGIVTETPGQLSLIMEYAPNGSLRDYLDKQKEQNRLLPQTFAHNLIYDIAYGMKELYAKGVQHRDLKAANVLLDRDMKGKVSDFGLSKADALITSISSKPTVVGTPAWQSPEELNTSARDRKKGLVNHDIEKCDMYSFAITTWEVLTCRLPFGGYSMSEIQGDVVMHELRPEYDKSELTSKYGNDCIQVLELCWDQTPSKRPTFSELIGRIKRFERDVEEHLTEKNWKAKQQNGIALETEKQLSKQKKETEKQKRETEKQKQIAKLTGKQLLEQKRETEKQKREAEKQKREAEKQKQIAMEKEREVEELRAKLAAMATPPTRKQSNVTNPSPRAIKIAKHLTMGAGLPLKAIKENKVREMDLSLRELTNAEVEELSMVMKANKSLKVLKLDWEKMSLRNQARFIGSGHAAIVECEEYMTTFYSGDLMVRLCIYGSLDGVKALVEGHDVEKTGMSVDEMVSKEGKNFHDHQSSEE